MAKKDEAKKEVILEGKIWAVIGYLWLGCFIPLIFKRDNPFAVFHARQGLVLFITWVVVTVLGIIPILGQVIAIIGNLLVLIGIVAGVLHALNGNYWKLPWLGDYAEKIEL